MFVSTASIHSKSRDSKSLHPNQSCRENRGSFTGKREERD